MAGGDEGGLGRCNESVMFKRLNGLHQSTRECKATVQNTILVVEDEPAIREMLEGALARAGFDAGEPVTVGSTEFRMLHFLMGHAERVCTRGQLLDRVWGSNLYVEERTVDVHLRRLRKALSSTGHDRLIQTVHGTGQRFSRHRACSTTDGGASWRGRCSAPWSTAAGMPANSFVSPTGCATAAPGVARSW